MSGRTQGSNDRKPLPTCGFCGMYPSTHRVSVGIGAPRMLPRCEMCADEAEDDEDDDTKERR